MRFGGFGFISRCRALPKFPIAREFVGVVVINHRGVFAHVVPFGGVITRRRATGVERYHADTKMFGGAGARITAVGFRAGSVVGPGIFISTIAPIIGAPA